MSRYFNKTFWELNRSKGVKTLLNKGGFTVVELIITVAIVALLVAIAIPNYTGYRYRTARTEAYTNIATIHSLEESYKIENNAYVTSTWTPSTIPGPTKSTWSTGNNFDVLGFSAKGSVYYRYGVGGDTNWVDSPTNGTVPESNNDDIIIQAEGDVDGDGAISQFYTTDELRTVIPRTNWF